MTAASLGTRTNALPPASGKAGFRGALASEWTKIRSVRSTVWILLILIVAVAGINVLGSYGWAHNLQQQNQGVPGAATPATTILDTRNLQVGAFFGQLIVIVLEIGRASCRERV